MKIIFSPFVNDSNKYIAILIYILKKNDIEVCRLSFWSLFTADMIHLNWFEIIKNRGSLRVYIDFLFKITALFILKIFNVKIGTTLHNRAGHDKVTQRLQNKLMKITIRLSSFVVIHSYESLDILKNDFGLTKVDKVFYVPHPHYIDTYGTEIPTSINNEKLQLLFLGAVKPYKNIELLIDVVSNHPETIELTIAGKAKDTYVQDLINYTKRTRNVNLELRFIQDDEIPLFISNCDCMVLPYDMSSSLNSGSVYLAFSYGKTVLCPNIGSINDLKKKEFVLTYLYSDTNEHIVKLKDALSYAVNIKQEDNLVFKVWGDEMKKYVNEFHNENEVIASLLTAYRYALKDSFKILNQKNRN